MGTRRSPALTILAVWGALFVIATFPAVAGSDVFSIDAHVISAGNSSEVTSSCYHMNAVVGEPVAGFSSSTDYALFAGFIAVAPPVSDDIFFSGFEDCTP